MGIAAEYGAYKASASRLIEIKVPSPISPIAQCYWGYFFVLWEFIIFTFLSITIKRNSISMMFDWILLFNFAPLQNKKCCFAELHISAYQVGYQHNFMFTFHL